MAVYDNDGSGRSAGVVSDSWLGFFVKTGLKALFWAGVWVVFPLAGVVGGGVVLARALLTGGSRAIGESGFYRYLMSRLSDRRERKENRASARVLIRNEAQAVRRSGGLFKADGTFNPRVPLPDGTKVVSSGQGKVVLSIGGVERLVTRDGEKWTMRFASADEGRQFLDHVAARGYDGFVRDADGREEKDWEEDGKGCAVVSDSLDVLSRCASEFFADRPARYVSVGDGASLAARVYRLGEFSPDVSKTRVILRFDSEESMLGALRGDTSMKGLVAVVTIALSIGVTKMSKRNAIVRKMNAVETLGCTQVICSDKTGTLTQNRMTVVKHYSEDTARLVRCMALCSDAKWDRVAGQAVGEPTEAALVADAAKMGFTSGDLDAANPRVGEAPFDSGRKMMSVVDLSPSGDYVQHTKGGPDVVLARCTMFHTSDGDVPMTDELRAKIMEQNKAMADDALRVMAAARVNYHKNPPASYEAADLEKDMVFIGLCGMIDPVRPEVKDAIMEAHGAGMRVVMITGDHIDTAVAIAKELGIVRDKSQAITGAELDKISDEDFFSRIEEIGVYARVQPEHKTRIVDTWKKKGMVVAMTGDGVNDAPSIKKADIGVGMGITGTDVTKGVADMVLADDNFATIIGAVEEGRRIYDNIRKAIQFLLSSNLAEVISVFVASLIGFVILEPTHLLWINLITDSLPALAMCMEEAEPDIMKRKPRNSKDGIFANGMGIDTLFQGIIIAALTLASYFIGISHAGVSLAEAVANDQAGLEGMTMAFLTLSMVEMFHSLNMRSRLGSIFKLPTQNGWAWGAFALALLLTWVVIETPLSQLFHFAELDLVHYGIAMALAFSIIPIIEIYKAIMRGVEKNRS